MYGTLSRPKRFDCVLPSVVVLNNNEYIIMRNVHYYEEAESGGKVCFNEWL